LQSALAAGQMPTREVVDGALILLGGALLLTPGFLSDCIGLVLLLPPTRTAVKRLFRPLLARWATRRFVPPGARRVYDATVVRGARGPDAPSRRPNALSQMEDPSGGDGSPDTE
jgi:UPF0716 protein FxsA